MLNRNLVLALALLGACSDPPPQKLAPVDIDPQHACAIDGMIIAQHDGPKAQLLRRDGSRAFFCDAKEVFEEALNPRHGKRIAAIWFQTLDDDPWESHPDGWTLAGGLYFVAGSAKVGPMGPTLATFKNRANAEDFAATHGGTVYSFEQIDRALIEKMRMQGIEDM